MKKKLSALIVSFALIAVCVSLIAGATFALFTSESGVNIAVTSAKVAVVAVVDEDNAVADIYNGGWDLTDGVITIETITPGDSLAFDIKVTNSSSIGIKYRTVVSCADEGLADKLEYTIGGVKTSATAWADVAVGGAIDDIHVVVSLPKDVGNDWQEKGCTLTVRVDAIQGNANVD